jgi:hypothetical protein
MGMGVSIQRYLSRIMQIQSGVPIASFLTFDNGEKTKYLLLLGGVNTDPSV